ncbi:gamma-carboxygeranoyl-CoA hydratase ['Osedax' symbiont bacterium Rs2_46_30_T18]|nr:gamma-carboxygeranoyl-CoA hydratase ['Osedax' symbiont bacterium Rs2_46_30_T18]
MSQTNVLLQLDDNGIATLCLNRPQVRNAFDDQMIVSLINAIESVEQQPQAKVLVLKANGDHFSAGADLNWMARMADNSPAQNLADAEQLARLMDVLNRLSKPSVAIIQGAAYGGAVGLAACCDMVFADINSTFCLSEVKLGLIPAVISPYVVRAIGERQARRYCISAEPFDAQTAKSLGLVHQVAENSQALQQQSQQWLAKLLKNAPLAMAAAKKLVMDVSGQQIEPVLIADTAQRIADIRASEEGIEGLNAFLQKRSPNWQHN